MPSKVAVAPVLFRSFVSTLILTGVVPHVVAESGTAIGDGLIVIVTIAVSDLLPSETLYVNVSVPD